MNELFYQKLCDAQAEKISMLTKALEASEKMLETYVKEAELKDEIISNQRELIETYEKIFNEAEKRSV